MTPSPAKANTIHPLNHVHEKIYAFLFPVCLSAGTVCLAQNTSPYWSLSGNSTATSASKLSTTNNIPLRLFTNNVERLRIEAAGNIGIATTAPKGKLSIQSSGSTPASIWVSSGVPLFVGLGENTPGNAKALRVIRCSRMRGDT
ncbi:MAG: hypothetical protein H0X41_10235 [Chitinophagaceae bacterium]|nr:hypothetical protein [Chitinophagaceae bacterium]